MKLYFSSLFNSFKEKFSLLIQIEHILEGFKLHILDENFVFQL